MVKRAAQGEQGSRMFSFPRPLSIYRRLCACKVNTGYRTHAVQACDSACVFVSVRA